MKLDDLFLAQCFKLCYLETKDKLSQVVGKTLVSNEKMEKEDLTHKIETYFDWTSFLKCKQASKLT